MFLFNKFALVFAFLFVVFGAMDTNADLLAIGEEAFVGWQDKYGEKKLYGYKVRIVSFNRDLKYAKVKVIKKHRKYKIEGQEYDVGDKFSCPTTFLKQVTEKEFSEKSENLNIPVSTRVLSGIKILGCALIFMFLTILIFWPKSAKSMLVRMSIGTYKFLFVGGDPNPKEAKKWKEMRIESLKSLAEQKRRKADFARFVFREEVDYDLKGRRTTRKYYEESELGKSLDAIAKADSDMIESEKND